MSSMSLITLPSEELEDLSRSNNGSGVSITC